MSAPTPITAIKNRILRSEEIDPTSIKANPRNWRVHPRGQRRALAGALETVGWVQQVIVNERTGNLVDGHARVAEAIDRHEATIPVLIVDISLEEEDLVLATLDPIAAMATTDKAKLEALLEGMTVDHEGLAQFMYTLGGKGKTQPTDPDEVPEVPDTAGIAVGDLFALGDHRILCGDATDPDAYAALFGTERASMVWTDPPWNVAIGKDSNPRHRQRPGLVNDDLSASDFRALLDGFAAPALALLDGFAAPALALLDGDFYCVLGAAAWPVLDLALRDAGLHWSATIIWAKDLFVLGRSNYHRRYEPIWYGWGADRTSSFNGARDLDDVWEIPRPRKSEEHPTMKPVELVERSIRNSSIEGGIVLDPFLGSGTTLIAATQSERRCFGMEIDPHYVAVAIARWEAFTGLKAELVDG